VQPAREFANWASAAPTCCATLGANGGRSHGLFVLGSGLLSKVQRLTGFVGWECADPALYRVKWLLVGWLGCVARRVSWVFHAVMVAGVLRESTGNLPSELTSFVGRRRELAEVRALLSASRLVTLTGMGGVGKTRLARRTASDARRAFADGVWQVELADLHEQALLVHTIAGSLGLRERNERWAIASLQDHLRDRQLLLLLDNCEHLVDACAVTVDALLRACPNLRVLATSREPLAVDGEHTYPVGALSVPDSVQAAEVHGLTRYEGVSLFVGRARAVLPGFVVDDRNRHAVVELCRRLDGVPLALELAALRLRALGPDQIVAELEDRYLLGRGNRSAPQRQQTLYALVDWSYQLCSEPERLLWSLVSVFEGGFELDAVREVCAGSALAGQDSELAGQDLVELTIGLVEKSVLVREEQADTVRYRMPVLIRDYGVQLLRQSSHERSLRRSHRDWFEAMAARVYAEWVGPEQLSWFNRLRREQANFRAAVEFSLTEPGEASHAADTIVALIHPLVAFGFLSEGRLWLDRALRQCPEPGLHRASALRAASMLAALQGDQLVATTMLRESRELAEQLGNITELAWVAHAGGLLALGDGDFAAAATLYEEARAGFQAAGDTHGLVHALSVLAASAALSGDADLAAHWVDEFMGRVEPGERWNTGWVLWALGVSQWRRGDNRRAVELELESLMRHRPFDDELGFGSCVEVLAWAAASDEQWQRAAELFGASRQALAAIGSPVASFGSVMEDDRRCQAATRARLGDAAFEAATRRGKELGFDETIALVTGKKTARPSTNQAAAEAASALSRREREIADLIAQGLSNKEIASALVIALRTAEGHVEHILTKLGFTSRTQIAAWSAEQHAHHGSDL
jgi:predicted ATPase/DNA-binding CsgD family transcriptional regulator